MSSTLSRAGSVVAGLLMLLGLSITSLAVVPANAAQAGQKPTIVYNNLRLPNGDTALVYSSGLAEIFNKDRTKAEFRTIPLSQSGADGTNLGTLPDKAQITATLMQAASTPYATDRVLVVYRDGVTAPSDSLTVPAGRLAGLRSRSQVAPSQLPAYTNDTTTNRLLTQLGVDSSQRLFQQFGRSTLRSMRDQAQASVGHPILDFSNAYQLHLTNSSVEEAVSSLMRSPDVVYASPAWTVTTSNTAPVPLPAGEVARSRQQAIHQRAEIAPRSPGAIGSGVPTNYTLTSSAQSLLNTPSVDAVPAFDEISRTFNQLPGQGEIITNVSLGDLTDASTATNSKDPCYFYALGYGPTTQIINGQRYINWPSMPLIPTYTINANGNLNGTGESCGQDPYLDEVGLDFSMMAPLPDGQQRAGAQGSGLTDLLGIAPGASYRLIVPGGSSFTNADVDAAFLAAAQQTPRPNVITASLSFGLDQYGFSARYIEDDPLTHAIITAIVHNYGISMCFSSNDGTRTFTNASIGPSGGTTPTNVIGSQGTPTNLNDVAFSTMPSQDYDSGAVDVGGTTLDDIFSVPPKDAATPEQRAQHAYPEVRWNGFTNFSSGDGTRVNVSAPSDNVLGILHQIGGDATAISEGVNGGTSASAPETAAAIAVALQVARLTGNTSVTNPVAMRSFLAQTGSPVPGVPQSDVYNQVGPQIDVGHAVETLLQDAGKPVTPGVARVAVEQRRGQGSLDATLSTATDPSNINLQGPATVFATNSDRNERAWITIAPDWEGVPLHSKYKLVANGRPMVLATTRWARLLPEQILNAAGYPLASTTSRTVTLTYSAVSGSARTVSTTFSLTFGPADSTTIRTFAPTVPPVVTGSTIPVSYDLSSTRLVSNPTLLVSQPGRFDPFSWAGKLYHPAYTMPLTALKGTVQVPVSALQGGGIYGIGIHVANVNGSDLYSDFAFTRVAPTPSSRPDAPILSNGHGQSGHFLEIPYGTPFSVSWDVSNVAGANGVMLEISAAGPSSFNNLNSFNNPNGTEFDHNGIDSGSIYSTTLAGTKGSITLSSTAVGLFPTMNHVVRVLPLHNGAPAGEAGEVSTITMDGVLAADGGYVNNGYGVNSAGNDAFLTSGQQTASGHTLTSVETFSQATNAITKTVASAQDNVYYTLGNGIFAHDVGLFGDNNGNFNLLNPVTAGTVGSAWTPPNNLFLSEGAFNQVNDTAAFLAYDPNGAQNDNYRVFTSNLRANTFGPIYDVSGPLASFGLPYVPSFAQDTATNTGVLPGADFFANCGAPKIITVNLGNGHVDSFNGVGAGFPNQLSVDSAAHKAFVTTDCDSGLGIYDLTAKTGTEAFLPTNGTGNNGLYTAVDSGRKLVLVSQAAGADFGVNNNSLSNVVEMGEDGSVAGNLERFNFFNSFMTVNANNLQINPSTRSGYIFGPLQQQLAPFKY